MSANLSRAFSLALVLLFAWTLLDAQGFRAQARLFPTAIAVAGLALALLHLALEFRRSPQPPAATEGPPVPVAAAAAAQVAAAEVAAEDTVPPAVRRRRTAAILGWILAFALAVWLIGFPLAVPLLTLCYLKLGAGESARTSIGFALAMGVVCYLLFVELIRVPFEPGLLTALLPF